MRYTELIIENKNQENIQKAFEQINHDCKLFLSSKSRAVNLIRADERSDNTQISYNQDFTQMRGRRQMSSNYDAIMTLHNYLNSKGFSATRQRGRFCFKENNIKSILNSAANTFGEMVFACFPVGSEWGIMYMDSKESKKLGFEGGDYGGDYLLGLASDVMDKEANEGILHDPSPEEIMKWFLDQHGDIFRHGKSINDVPNKHECVLYAPKVHMLNANLLVHNPDLQKILYKGIS